jgi:hypothetical protein
MPMSNTIRSGIATTRIDRRKVLHHSAAGLAIPALVAAGRPSLGGEAHSVLDKRAGFDRERCDDIGNERRGTVTGAA